MTFFRTIPSCLAIASILALAGCGGDAGSAEAIDTAAEPVLGDGDGAVVVAPTARFHGKTYAEWSARWWHWSMELPVAGHPFLADPNPTFNVAEGERGGVWFLGAPFGTTVRNVTIPRNKALFIAVVNAECSSLEAPPFFGATEAARRACAKGYADTINPASLFFTVDGVPVQNLSAFRVSSPQLGFDAPTPWIFGDTGGAGRSVGDGYQVLVTHLAPGAHVVHYGSTDPAWLMDMTYNVTVRANGDGDDEDSQD